MAKENKHRSKNKDVEKRGRFVIN